MYSWLGSQMADAYSILGRMRVRYASFLMWDGLLGKPSWRINEIYASELSTSAAISRTWEFSCDRHQNYTARVFKLRLQRAVPNGALFFSFRGVRSVTAKTWISCRGFEQWRADVYSFLDSFRLCWRICAQNKRQWELLSRSVVCGDGQRCFYKQIVMHVCTIGNLSDYGSRNSTTNDHIRMLSGSQHWNVVLF